MGVLGLIKYSKKTVLKLKRFSKTNKSNFVMQIWNIVGFSSSKKSKITKTSHTEICKIKS